MNILIINGSPKGKNSVTIQTLEYLKLIRRKHAFDTIHAAQLIKLYERDFTDAEEKLKWADLYIFAYPVYTFIAPSQLHRFIELMKGSKTDFSKKYATQITTSKHFYDVTAHKYIEDNCKDMKMHVIKGLSADMDDLTTAEGRRDARAFFDFTIHSVENGLYPPTLPRPRKFDPKFADMPEKITEAQNGNIVIVADIDEGDGALHSMINRFRAKTEKKTKVVNIREYPFRGGCLGCFNCAVSGKCVYKDGFDDFLRNEIQTADAIVYAFTIKDHSMGSLFKMYDDRQFCNGHRTVTMGMPFAYLINGAYSKEENLRMILEARAEVGGNFLAGVATNERDVNDEIDRLASTLSYAIDHSYNPPKNFYGVGGMKIFRDLIWEMQGMMRADHKFYKEHGQYDFPQKKPGRMIAMYLVGSLISSPKIKKKIGSKMTEGMLIPYKKVLDDTKKKLERTPKEKNTK